MEIEGKIIQDLGIQEGISKAGNPWKKQEWLLETIGTQFPKKVKFTVFGERRMEEMQLVPGENYRVSIDIESRDYQGRWYTDINAYSAMRMDGSMPPMGATSYGQPAAPYGQPAPAAPFGQQPAAPAAVDPFASSGNDTDDLPF